MDKLGDTFKNLISLSDYCKKYEWPRKPQWLHWIYSANEITFKCIKRISNRYFVDLQAWKEYIDNSTVKPEDIEIIKKEDLLNEDEE